MLSSKRATGIRRRSARILALLPMLGAAHMMAACSYGDPCLRHTDCGSGFVCVEGKCQVDLGDNPPDDAAPVSDATVSGDAGGLDTSGGGTSDVPSDADTEEGTSDGDAAGPDASRDVSSSSDGSRDALDADAIDARASVDGGDVSGDVGTGADSGISRDADVTTDAADAAG